VAAHADDIVLFKRRNYIYGYDRTLIGELIGGGRIAARQRRQVKAALTTLAASLESQTRYYAANVKTWAAGPVESPTTG